MSNFGDQGNKILSLILIVILLQACSSLPAHKNGSSTNKQNIGQLLKQAQSASPDEKGALLIQAANLLIANKRYEKSSALLVNVEQQRLSSALLDDFRLYYGETLLALGAKEASLKQLRSISTTSSKPLDWQIRYAQSLSESHLANHNYYESARLRIELEDIINTPAMLSDNNEKIWHALSQIETQFLSKLITDFNSKRVNGWLEIVAINKRWGYYPQKLLTEIEGWKKRYPLHPASINQPESLKRATNAVTFSPTKIAVLLPLSGRLGHIGSMVHEGIIAAYYQSQYAEKAPLLSFYDTAAPRSALAAYQKAISEGADFIIGPLTKENINHILNQESLATPVLTLNRLDEQRYRHSNTFQFGLPIEDEAIQAAQHAFEKGFKKAVALLPNSTTGIRARNAFKHHFEQLGGELISVETYKNPKLIKQKVQRLLGVDASQQRKRSLQQLLSRNLEFTMRRRQDADFIFMVASPTIGRRIKPFINYYFAHDLPVIATSSIYGGKPNSRTDLDLNGIEFPDMPLLLSQRPEFVASRKNIEQSIPEAISAQGRFFALGFDGYNILSQLSILQAFPTYLWSGLTGKLSVDSNGLIHRHLTWALFNKGNPNTIEEQKQEKHQQIININSDANSSIHKNDNNHLNNIEQANR